MAVVAFDLGSSSVRALVLDEELRSRAVARRPAGLRQDAAGAATVDADTYVDAAEACLDELRDAGMLAEVTGVAASCQWHSLLPLDARGRPLGPVLSWLDTRPQVTTAPSDAAALRERTGAWWHELFWPVRIAWLRAQGIDAAMWTGLGEYFAARLLGAAEASVSSASGTGAMDTQACRWDTEALNLAGLDETAVPKLAPDDWRGRLVPQLAHRWPQLAAAEWALPVGDGAASTAGTGCLGPERLSLTIGTSAAVRLIVPGAPAPPELVWRYRVDRERSVLGVAYSGGGVLHQWAVRLVGGDPGEAALNARAPGAHGLISLPYHAGRRPPMPAGATGTLHGLRLSTTPSDVVAATVEGMCHEMAGGAAALDPTRSATAVLGGGAVAASPWLVRRLTAALGGRALRCEEAEVGARGAAVLAFGGPVEPDLVPVEVPPDEVAAMAAADVRHRALRDRLSML